MVAFYVESIAAHAAAASTANHLVNGDCIDPRAGRSIAHCQITNSDRGSRIRGVELQRVRIDESISVNAEDKALASAELILPDLTSDWSSF